MGTYTYNQTQCGRHAVSSITGKGAYCYDQNGNMLSGDNRQLTYSSFNKPTYIKQNNEASAFSYGPDQQRYKQVTTGAVEKVVYYVGSYEKEIRDNRIYHRIQIGDVAIVEKVDDNAESINYTLRDHLGSLIATVSDTGTIKRLFYDPWGKRLDLPVAQAQSLAPFNLASFLTPRGFTGHEHLDNVGLIHMNGRVYDPMIARFVSADPFIQSPTYLQSYNRYSYVWNSPLRMTDPSGYFSIGNVFKKLERSVRHEARRGEKRIRKNKDSLIAVAAAVADVWGCSGYCSATVSAYNTKKNGGDLGDTVLGALSGYALGNLAIGGANAFSQGFYAGSKWVVGQYVNVKTREEVGRFANRNGMSLAEFNAVLLGMSFVGNTLVGTRVTGDFNDSGKQGIYGFLSRQNTGFIESGSLANAIVGLPFDVIDTVLGYQGLLTASSFDYMGRYGNNSFVQGHSLGTLDTVNLNSFGLASGGRIFSLPFGNVAPGNVQVNIGVGDAVNGMALGLLFNPRANLVTQNNGCVSHVVSCYF